MISPQEEAYYQVLITKKSQDYARLNRQCLTYPELIFLGDSITEWFPIEGLLTPQKSWVNRGIAAASSQDLIDHLDSLVFGQSVTDVVLLIGTNDLVYQRSTAEIATNVQTLIEAIKADQPLATVHLLEVLPVNEASAFTKTVRNRRNQEIKGLNQAYQTLTEQNWGVDLVPTYQAFCNSEGQLAQELTTDGLHLSPLGYQVLADCIKQTLNL